MVQVAVTVKAASDRPRLRLSSSHVVMDNAFFGSAPRKRPQPVFRLLAG